MIAMHPTTDYRSREDAGSVYLARSAAGEGSARVCFRANVPNGYTRPDAGIRAIQ